MKLFNKHLTKWIPLGNYQHGYTDYIVFVRKNLKSGMMYFKVKKVHAWTACHGNILKQGLIDVQQQWDKIFNAKSKDL